VRGGRGSREPTPKKVQESLPPLIEIEVMRRRRRGRGKMFVCPRPIRASNQRARGRRDLLPQAIERSRTQPRSSRVGRVARSGLEQGCNIRVADRLGVAQVSSSVTPRPLDQPPSLRGRITKHRLVHPPPSRQCLGRTLRFRFCPSAPFSLMDGNSDHDHHERGRQNPTDD
jgi:hypothetical protein